MKLIWMVFACVVLLLAATDSQAQYRLGRMWVVGSGVVLPLGPDAFSDLWKSGFGLHGGVHYCLDDGQRVSVRATAGYERLSPNTNDVLVDLNVVNPEARLQVLDGSGSIFHLELNLKVSPRKTEGRFVPYAIGGPGFLRVAQDVRFVRQNTGATEQVNQSETNVGWGLGAGVDFVLRRDLTMFFEGQFTMVFTDQAGPRFMPFRLGIMF